MEEIIPTIPEADLETVAAAVVVEDEVEAVVVEEMLPDHPVIKIPKALGGVRKRTRDPGLITTVETSAQERWHVGAWPDSQLTLFRDI